MKTILIQLDTDTLPSAFDRVVAVDSGVEHLFSYGQVDSENVTGLIHGAIFTRGPADLKNTAIFIGGSNVVDGEKLLRKVTRTFFGPMQVSLMMDSNGCNTTAAAAVASARKHLRLENSTAVVLGSTGPVGQRVAELLAREKVEVTLVSRTLGRAEIIRDDIKNKFPDARINRSAATSSDDIEAVCHGHQIVIAAGAAGICFLSESALSRIDGLKLAIDLNAVPPVGIADIGPMDKAAEKSGVICYGALGVGGLKMKVHRQAVKSLFETNNRVLDTQEIYELALHVAGLVS